MGISPLPRGFPAGQKFGDNPTENLPDTHWLIRKYGNYQPNGHTGTDFPAPIGTPVYALEAGTVMWAGPGTQLPGDNSADGWASRWYLDKAHVGNLVAIDHGSYTSLIYHLNKVHVKAFQKVGRGHRIADVGTTGRSTGPHAHLDIITHDYAWTNGLYGRVDPAPYIADGYPGKTAAAVPPVKDTTTRRNGMIWLTDLADQLRTQGLTVVEVPGWKTRGFAGRGFYGIAGVLHHHTATGRAAYASSNAPTLNLLVNGRSDLPGPLCNIAFGRDGTVYVVAAGWANHAGAGAAPGFPANMGNGWLIGIEAESSGVVPWDWTADQLRVWPYLAAGLERVYLSRRDASLRLQLGHKEYSSEGKIDPAGINLDTFRASINQILASKKPAPPTKKPKTALERLKAMSDAEVDRLVATAVRRVLREEYTKLDAKGKPTKSKTSIVRELQWTGENFAEIRRAHARIEKLLQVIALAVTPARLALSVWGYKGSTAHKHPDGKPMDAYATLNTILGRAPSGATAADPTQEATK